MSEAPLFIAGALGLILSAIMFAKSCHELVGWVVGI